MDEVQRIDCRRTEADRLERKDALEGLSGNGLKSYLDLIGEILRVLLEW